MCDVFVFLHYLIFLSRYLSVDFFGIFKIKLDSIFLLLRLRTRYLSVKSPVRFDIWFFFNINLSIFRVLTLNCTSSSIFRIFLYCGTKYLSVKSPFRF